jgi:hypothetical protein
MKRVKWPVSWNDPYILDECPNAKALLEDVLLSEYPFTLDHGLRVYK